MNPSRPRFCSALAVVYYALRRLGMPRDFSKWFVQRVHCALWWQDLETCVNESGFFHQMYPIKLTYVWELHNNVQVARSMVGTNLRQSRLYLNPYRTSVHYRTHWIRLITTQIEYVYNNSYAPMEPKCPREGMLVGAYDWDHRCFYSDLNKK